MIILLSKHAQDKMALLGITKQQIKDVITKGSKFKQTDGYLSIYTYLKVAYKELKPDVYYIKTVFIERR